MRNPRIVRMDDYDGRDVVYVEMTNRIGVFAKVDADDYAKLVATGIPTRWFLNSSGVRQPEYVRVSLKTVKGGTGTVARLILDAGAGEGVSYRSNDHLDLRRCNLVLKERRWAKGRTFTPADLDFRTAKVDLRDLPSQPHIGAMAKPAVLSDGQPA